MTEGQKFNVPPVPPKAPAFGGPAHSAADGKTSASIPPDNFAAALKLSPRIFETKIMAAILGGCVILGLILGLIFFGGSSNSGPQQVSQAFVESRMGVVPNPDIRENLRRCGMVSNSSACVFYIVNHSRDDHYAEYFFDDVAKLTSRAPYRVRIENQSYAKTRIPPGYVARVKVPPLR